MVDQMSWKLGIDIKYMNTLDARFSKVLAFEIRDVTAKKITPYSILQSSAGRTVLSVIFDRPSCYLLPFAMAVSIKTSMRSRIFIKRRWGNVTFASLARQYPMDGR